MPQVTIDNKTVDVPNGTLIVEAAKKVNIEIPVFCYHPTLDPVGMCRMCLVEVGTPKRGKDGLVEKDAAGNPVIAWMPKLQTACTTVVSEGMSVHTQTQAVADARRAIVEFLLTSHPLDCPICDKGGECPLQNLTMAYGPGQSRFAVESKFHNEKRVPLGDLIVLDRERCIQCSRCIRFQDEIADDHVLGFQARGRALEITTLSDPPFDSKFSGNTVDICPVGALTSRDFRLSARVWEVKDQSSVCPHCSVGCNILIGERDHQIKRIVPRENQAVNQIWLCDKGRFVHHFTTSPNRLTTPLIRKDGRLLPSTWSEAVDLIATRLSEIKHQQGAKSIGGIAGDRAANEDLYLFQKLFREVIHSGNLDHRIGWSETNGGANLVKLYGAAIGTDLGALGRNVTVLIVGADPEEEQPVLRLRLTRSARHHGANLIFANGRLTKVARYSKQSIIYQYGGEAAFLLGMVRAVLDEGLENKEYIASHVRKFEAFVESLRQYTLQELADLSGVPSEAIRSAARAFAQSPDGLILYGREAMHAESVDPAFASAITALLLLTGHVGRPNNGLVALYPHNNSSGAIDFGLVPDLGTGRKPITEIGLGAREMCSGQVRALYVMASDPVSDRGFVKPEFLIVQDVIMTRTAQIADIVLPAQAFSEREGTFTNTERRVQLFHGAVKPIGEAQADWAILTRIAKALGADWAYKNPSQIMDEIASRVPSYAGMSYSVLSENVVKPRHLRGQGNPSHETTEIAMGELRNLSSGKQWPSVAERDPGAKFDLVWNELRQPESAPDSWLVLAVGRALYDRGTLVNESKIVQPRVPKAYVEINSHDAEDRGIADGERVNVHNESCTVQLDARVDGHVPPGVVMIPNNLDGVTALPMGKRVQVEKAII